MVKLTHMAAIAATGALLAPMLGGAASAASGPFYRVQGTPQIYILHDGRLHWVTSPLMFAALGGQWGNVATVNALPAPVGTPVQLVREAGTNPVFLVTQGQEDWIPNAAVFNAHHYQWRNVFTVYTTPWSLGPDVLMPNLVSPPPVGNFTVGYWNPGTTAGPMELEIPLINGYAWQQTTESNQQHWRSLWTAGNAQVALSFHSSPIGAFIAPPGDPILENTITPNFAAWLWQGAGGRLHGTELVNTGTNTYGWPDVFGMPLLDKTLLINVTLPTNAPNAQFDIAETLADWQVEDRVTGAVNAETQPAGQGWMPTWSLNPVMNSNVSQVPQWITQAGGPL